MSERVEELLCEYEGATYFTNPDFYDAIVGVSEEGRVIYDYYKMIECLMEEEDWTQDDAIDWIEFNTIRSIPYMGPQAPIIMYPVDK